MEHKKNAGIIRIVKAMGYSWSGLRAAWRYEAAFRQELAICALLLPVACLLEVSPAERAILIASLFLVLIVELVNSAIEAIIDRIGMEHHEFSGRAKDIGSAAVLLAIILASVIWGVILLLPL